MQARDLAELMFTHAANLHPEFTREQQMVWIIGVLSDVVLEKNLMDNIVFARLSQRIDQLYLRQEQNKGE